MKLLKIVQLQNKAEKTSRTKTEVEKAGSPNDHQNANGTVTAPNKEMLKALIYVGALKDVEGALQSYGVQHLEETLELRTSDLIEAGMSLMQID